MEEVPSDEASVKLFATLSVSPGVRVLQFGLIGMDVAEECMHIGASLVKEIEALGPLKDNPRTLIALARFHHQLDLVQSLCEKSHSCVWALDWLESEGNPAFLLAICSNNSGLRQEAFAAHALLQRVRAMDPNNEQAAKELRACLPARVHLRWSFDDSPAHQTPSLARQSGVHALVRGNTDGALELNGIARLVNQAHREHFHQRLWGRSTRNSGTLEEFRRMLRSSKHLSPEDALYPLCGHMRALGRRLGHVASVALEDGAKNKEPLAEFATTAVTIAAAEALVPWPKRPKLGSYLTTARHAAERLTGQHLTPQRVVREVWEALGEDPMRLTVADRVARHRERARKERAKSAAKSSAKAADSVEKTPPANNDAQLRSGSDDDIPF